MAGRTERKGERWSFLIKGFRKHWLVHLRGIGGIMTAVPLSPQVDLGIVMATERVLHTQDAAEKLCQMPS